MKTKKKTIESEAKTESITEGFILKIINDRYDMMLRKQVENPNLILPKNFEKFIHSQLFLDFLKVIYEYCVELHKIEQKQKILENEVFLFLFVIYSKAKGRITAPP